MVRSLLCAVICLVVFSSAKADTFTFTSGSASTGFGHIGLNASGPNISIQQNSGGEPGNLTFAPAGCNPAPCGPGSILNVGGVFNASQLNSGFSRGTATINGVTFNNVFITGTLNFTGSVVLPADFVNDHIVDVPFVMTGQLQGFIPCSEAEPFAACQQVFDVTVNGSGIAHANFQFFGTRSVVYEFSDPVPEPATLGLLGAGLLGILKIRKRRQSRRW